MLYWYSEDDEGRCCFFDTAAILVSLPFRCRCSPPPVEYKEVLRLAITFLLKPFELFKEPRKGENPRRFLKKLTNQPLHTLPVQFLFFYKKFIYAVLLEGDRKKELEALQRWEVLLSKFTIIDLSCIDLFI
ncbi:hypothetical protein M9H77_16680 [Catharanthus roseus]|uniref:Uncharacterized protein n=1 Tax=Catharanthus roseus TaxID=4058 RepID=A0ACC0B2F5_CATRO|nr:hypothetical protein M9H77_16680 [Catharanthus roseus]